MLDWTRIPDAVSQLLETIDDRTTNPERFRLDSITITPNTLDAGLIVAALDKSGKHFKYAMYVNGDSIEADGF